MLGNVKYIPSNIIHHPWILNMNGFEFEDYITSVIKYSLCDLFAYGLSVEQTPRTRDHGKDLIIKSPIPFSLFGKRFSLNNKKSICIYVEFKSSMGNKIQLEKFSKNILIANDSNIDYFVLITNTTISPFSFYEADKNAQEHGYIFYIVDQWCLIDFLQENNAMKGEYIPTDDAPEVMISYQIDYSKREGLPYLTLYLMFQNFSNTARICRFQLKTDRNWLLSETSFEVFLDAGKGHCRKIGVKKEYFDGIDDIVLSVELNQKQSTVVINGNAIEYNFETPLTGQQHCVLIQEITDSILKNKKIELINLQGEAGIGKTRIINEITKKVLLSGVEVLYYVCNQNTGHSTLEDLTKFLNEKFSSQVVLSSLKDVVQIPMHFKRYLVIIEDIHNADKDFFSSLKLLATVEDSQTPFTIIVAGRDDYTVYNESYFSFLSWINEDRNNSIYTYKIPQLTDHECASLIRAIIRGVPDFVAEKIQVASKNNPFYVCQFIEYLLETKLIYLLNRNTVGIMNVASFSQKIYIPETIEALLEKRYQYIGNLPDGKYLQGFLLALCHYGIEVEENFGYLFWGNDCSVDIRQLYKCHFLRISHRGKILFDHENIYLFLKQKLKDSHVIKPLSKLISGNPELLNLYSDLQRAVIFYYCGDLASCKQIIQPAVEEIQTAKNISSCNLSPQFVEVYPIIYNLAKRSENYILQNKTLIAWMYVSLHNLSVARGSVVLEEIIELIKRDHPQNQTLMITAQQLQAHLFLQSDKISQAKKILIELCVQERMHPELFDDETRFDLFDRLASIYTQENHKMVAKSYNQLSFEVASRLNDKKLLTLSKIIEAKIKFYDDTNGALSCMYEAKQLLAEDMATRIDCHNDLGILTAKLFLGYKSPQLVKKLQKEVHILLRRAEDIEYPGAIIRAHYLAAVISYFEADTNEALEKVEYHLNAGVADSIRSGISKLIPQIYCMLAIKAAREGQPAKKIYEYFQTMLAHMRQCDQFFLGALDFTGSNIILFTNYVIFLNEYNGLESELYIFLSEIKYYGSNIACDFQCSPNRRCYYSCLRNMDVFKKNYQDVLKGALLFVGNKKRYPVKDSFTPYYIPLGV